MKLRYLLFILALALAACSPQEQSAVSNLLVEEAEPMAAPVEVEQPDTSAEQPPADPAPVEEQPPANPPVKTGLEATDPTTVTLASGQPTLVEFFAFW